MAEDISCGVRFLRALLLIANILFIIIGLALIGLGIYIKLSNDFSSVLDQFNVEDFNGQSLSFLAFVLIGGGAFTVLLALFGCMGTLWNNRCLLGFYAVVLGILMVVELTGFILAFVYKNQLQETYKTGLDNVLKKGLAEHSNHSKILEIFATLQSNLKCCGANNISDYLDASRLDLAQPCISAGTQSKGCSQAIIELLQKNLPAIGISLGVVLLVELFGLLFAIILAVALRHVDRKDFSSRPGEVLGELTGRRRNY